MKTMKIIVMAGLAATLIINGRFLAADAQNEAPGAPAAGGSTGKSFQEAKDAFWRLISVTDRINVNPLNLPFANKITGAIPRSTDDLIKLAEKIGEAGKSVAIPLDSFVKTYTYPALDLFLKAAVFVFDRLGNLFRYVFRI